MRRERALKAFAYLGWSSGELVPHFRWCLDLKTAKTV
jgi:hypothetical protein